MIAITVFDNIYCNSLPVVERVVKTTGYRLVTDVEIINAAAELSGMDEARLAAAFPTGVNDSWDVSEHAEAVGWLKLAVAQKLSENSGSLFYGYSAHLVPRWLKNILRVCLVSGMTERLQEGVKEKGCPVQEIRSHILADDIARANWVMTHTECIDPWDNHLYDLVLPVSAMSIGQSVRHIVEQLCSVALQLADTSHASLDDFLLAAKAQVQLTRWGSCISIASRDKSLTVSINNKAQTLKEVARDLYDSISGIEGVKNVTVGTGRSFSEADIYCKPEGMRSSGNQALGCAHGARGRDEDIVLAAKVKAALSCDEYPVSVHIENGSVALTLLDHAIMLRVVAKKLLDTVARIDGVENVDVGIVRDYHQTPICRSARQEVAIRILLSDDREFPPYLSDRLQRNDTLSISLFDGETAGNENDDRKPEVFILDADHPEFNMEEGVQRVRSRRPKAKVVVLSAIGLEKPVEELSGMGVSAYLSKPVSASVLGNAIKSAIANICYT